MTNKLTLEDLIQRAAECDLEIDETASKIDTLNAVIRDREKSDLAGEKAYPVKDRKTDADELHKLESSLRSLRERRELLIELKDEEQEAAKVRQATALEMKMRGMAETAVEVFKAHRAAFDEMFRTGVALEDLQLQFNRLSAERANLLQTDPTPFPFGKVAFEYLLKCRNAQVPVEDRRSEQRFPLWKGANESALGVGVDPANPSGMVSTKAA